MKHLTMIAVFAASCATLAGSIESGEIIMLGTQGGAVVQSAVISPSQDAFKLDSFLGIEFGKPVPKDYFHSAAGIDTQQYAKDAFKVPKFRYFLPTPYIECDTRNGRPGLVYAITLEARFRFKDSDFIKSECNAVVDALARRYHITFKESNGDWTFENENMFIKVSHVKHSRFHGTSFADDIVLQVVRKDLNPIKPAEIGGGAEVL